MPVQFGIHIYMGPLYLRSEYLQTEAEAMQRTPLQTCTQKLLQYIIIWWVILNGSLSKTGSKANSYSTRS